jgi:hypothetical protein
MAVGDILEGRVAGIPDSAAFLQVDVVELVARFLPPILELLTESFRGDLADILASSEEFVAQAGARLELDEEQLAGAKRALLDLEEKEVLEHLGLMTSKVAGEPLWTFERVPTPTPAAGSGSPLAARSEFPVRSYACARIATELIQSILRMPWYTHVLTAERAAIQLFSRELAINRTQLVDDLLLHGKSSSRRAATKAAVWDKLRHRARRYPLAIRDGLSIANDPATYKAKSSVFAPLADQLEAKLLGGTIRVDEEGEMSFHPSGSDTHLSLHLASSSVKSLAGLSLYLRHIAAKNQFLIIDEPELNLHPDNQRRVARVLARLVRSGIKVLISTHSDYIIRELNNLIMLSADKDGGVRQRLGYEEAETLSPHQVGAYLFDSERANPIEVMPTGIEVATIEREINALNSVSQDIYFSLFNKTSA